MSLLEGEPTQLEIRYDGDTLRKVTALAARLQHEQQETFTAEEIEAIGAEVGLQPALIRQALVRLDEERRPAEPRKVLARAEGRRASSSIVPAERWDRSEVLSALTALGIPFWWTGMASVVAGSMNRGPDDFTAFLMMFMIFAGPIPLSVGLGFLAGRWKVALASVGTLVMMLALVLLASGGGGPVGYMVVPTLMYILVGLPVTGTMAWWGTALRQRFLPSRTEEAPRAEPPREERIARPVLVDFVHSLQTQLENRKQHRAFLCLDVVNSWEMKQRTSELASEHAFRQLRGWIEQVVQSCGGEAHNAGGDGTLCVFQSDGDALRAARRVQEGVERFNAEQSGLPVPFQVRCGVSSGEVLTTNYYPGYAHGPVVDRAVALQRQAEVGDVAVSGEVTTAALTELGVLARVPLPVAGEPAFSWKAGQRAANGKQTPVA